MLPRRRPGRLKAETVVFPKLGFFVAFERAKRQIMTVNLNEAHPRLARLQTEYGLAFHMRVISKVNSQSLLEVLALL
jgi:hypothetical protein